MDESPDGPLRVYVDLGGSRVRVSRRSHGGLEDLVDSPSPDDAERFVDLLVSVIPVGVPVEILAGLPGLVDSAGRSLHTVHSFLQGVDAQQLLASEFPVDQVFVVNDVKAHAAGYTPSGNPSLFVALGTSIGGALRIGDLLFGGRRGLAGELGHLCVPGSERPCPCGLKGCLDTVSSGAAIEAQLGPDWWQVAPSAGVADVLERRGRDLGAVLAAASALLDLDEVVVAGHLVWHDPFFEAVRAELGRGIWPSPSLQRTQIDRELTCRGLDRLFDGEVSIS